MWRTIGITLHLLFGAVVVLIACVAVLFIRPPHEEPWRPMPPPRR